MNVYALISRSDKRLTAQSVVRSISLLLIAFHLVAAGRALIPGLCATQEAIKRAEAGAGCTTDATSCCVVYAGEMEKNGAASIGEPENAHPSCAFCNLVLAPVIPAPYATVALLRPDTPLSSAYSHDEALSCDNADTNIGRDPPFNLFS